MAIRLEHVGVGAATAKFEATKQFYVRAFGWHVIKESPAQLAFIGDGEGGRIELLSNDAPPMAAPHHLAFIVDLGEFETVMESLRAAGAEVQAPSENPFGDRLAFFTDPAGNRAQIVGRSEPLQP